MSFEFFTHKGGKTVGPENILDNETTIGTTTNTQELNDGTTEIANKAESNLIYSPEDFERAKIAFEADPDFFIDELNEELSVDSAKFDVEGGGGNILNFSDCAPSEDEVGAADKKVELFNWTRKFLGGVTAASALFWAACDRRVDGDVSLSPGVGIEKNEDGTYGVKFKLGFGGGIKTTDADGNPIDKDSSGHKNTSDKEVESKGKGSASKKPTSTGDKTSKKGDISERGGGEELAKILKEILPSGDPVNGSLKMSDATFNAIQKGFLVYDKDANVFCLGVMKDRAKQGIPVNTLIYYGLVLKGVVPHPPSGSLGGVKDFKDYSVNGRGNFSTFKYDEFEGDIISSINLNDYKKDGKVDAAKVAEVKRFFLDAGFAMAAALTEWKKQNEAGRRSLYENHVKPYLNRQ